MEFVTKVFYGGAVPCYNANTLICVTLYLNKPITKQIMITKTSFVYQFARFRYIPHWSWWTGIAEFSHSNDTDQINPNDISPHIYEYNSNSHQLQTTLNDVANHPLNRNIPWWDINIIHCNDNNQSQQQQCQTVVVFRCDHCLGDGLTLMKFLMPRLLSDSTGNSIDFEIKPRKPAKLSCCTIFGIIINALWSVYALLVKTSDTFNETIYKMHAKFGNQSLMHRSIPLQSVKAIQTILNNDNNTRKELDIMDDHYISMNDVCMSISSGALRGVLLETNDKEWIDNATLKSLMVIAKPFEMERAKTIQNGWILASIPFYVNIENHITRIIETANALKPIKNPYHLWTTFAFYEKIGNFWIYAIKAISHRLSCTHCCHYSMLNFSAYKEDDTFIFGTDIKVMDIGVATGDTVKTHIIEIFKFGERISLNITCGHKGEQYALKWFTEFENVSNELLNSLKSMQNKYVSV